MTKKYSLCEGFHGPDRPFHWVKTNLPGFEGDKYLTLEQSVGLLNSLDAELSSLKSAVKLWVREYSRLDPGEVLLRGDEPRVNEVRVIAETCKEE